MYSLPYSYFSFIEQFEQCRETTELFIYALDEYTFLRRPETNSWCIAECFDHLQQFGNIYFTLIRKRLYHIDSHPSPVSDSFPPRWYWKLIIDWFEPPYKIKVKTVDPFQPDNVAGLTRQDVLASFSNLQDQFVKQLEEVREERYNLGKINVRNPILTFISMTLSECYALVLAHQRRHIWQARQILKRLDAYS